MFEILEPEQIFAGRYRIQRFLAKGGFGAVYAAERIDTEAKVALKVLWPNVLETQAAIGQFSLEARVASRIASEHVVRVYDVGVDTKSQRPFLAMELLVGKHFEELVEERGPLARRDLAVYYRQIGSALDKAHGYVDREGARRPIVHRDLKPENLFLTHREDGQPLVKILDFGLAKVLTASANTSRELKGTPLFMAFEQAAVAPVTPQTDIWALGLVAFYLLTGKIYWLSANTDESPFSRLFTEVLSTPLDPPSERARAIGCDVELPAGFDAWFERCVNRDASRRFETAGECANALSALLLEDREESKPAGKSLEPGAVPLLLAASAPTVRSPTPFVASVDKSGIELGRSFVSGRRRRMQLLVASLIAGLSVVIGLLGSGVWRGKSGAQAGEPDQTSSAMTAVETSWNAARAKEQLALPAIVADAALLERGDQDGGKRAREPARPARPPTAVPAASGRVPSYVYGER